MNAKPVSNETLLTQLQWRYATKQFDPSRKIPAADWKTLEESLVLTPSSFGLQPWKFLVIENPAIREQLVPASWGQRQVADASHLVVFAVKQQLSAEDVDRHIARTAELRGINPESLNGLRSVILRFLDRPAESFSPGHWAACQAYIALGQFMACAAMLGIDTCPMEGFEPAKYDQILGLTQHGYNAVVAVPAGYRAPDDKYAGMPKVRFPASEIIEHRN